MVERELQQVRRQIHDLIDPKPAKPIATWQVGLAFQSDLVRIEENQIRYVTSGAEGRGVRIGIADQSQQTAIIVPVLGDDRFVLLVRYRYAPGKWSIEFPRATTGGEDTSWKVPVEKELTEQAGLTCGSVRLLGAINGEPGLLSATTAVVAADGCQSGKPLPPSPEATEEIAGTVTVTADCLDELIAQGGIECALTLASLLLYRTSPTKVNPN